MIEKIRKWIGKHYISVIIILTVIITIAIYEVQLIGRRYLTSKEEQETIDIIIQFLGGFLGGICSSIVVIYVAKLQNNSQNKFLKLQERNERQRMLLNFYIEKMEQLETMQIKLSKDSNYFIQNYEKLTKEEIKSYFNILYDDIVVLLRYKHIFCLIEMTEEWQKIENIVGEIHAYFTIEAKNLKEKINPNLADEYRNKYYIDLILTLSKISKKILVTQEESIKNLFFEHDLKDI